MQPREEALRQAIAEIDTLTARYSANAERWRDWKRGRKQHTWRDRLPVAEVKPMLTETYTCPQCKDTGMVVIWRDSGKYGWNSERREGEKPTRYDLVPCACRAQAVAQQRAQRIHAASSLTPEMESMTFASYNRDWDPDAFDAAWAYARALESGGTPTTPFQFYSGTYGSGKTHLIAAIAHHAMQHDRQPLFTVVPELLNWLRAGFDMNDKAEKMAFQARFNAICDADVLLLDDLGAENSTEWAREQLFTIINHRHARRSPTVFSSNCMPSQLEKRVASRINDIERTQRVYTVDKDYRSDLSRLQKGA